MNNTPGNFLLQAGVVLPQSARGGKARANNWTYRVSGEYVTMKQISARLGVSDTTAARRLKACVGQPTWEKLQ